MAEKVAPITRLTPEQQSAVLYWPMIAKIPIIPCDSRVKGFNFPNWPNADLTTEDWNTNVAAGLYDNGIALRLGQSLQPGLYSFALDFDGEDAVLEFFGVIVSINHASSFGHIRNVLVLSVFYLFKLG
ncbi:MAG: hypothetical protein ACJ71R_02210 [Nitrososphaeraceae archaeon]